MANVRVTVKLDQGAARGLMKESPAQSTLDKCARFALAAQKTTCPVDTGYMIGRLQIGVTNGGLSRAIGILPDKPVDYVLPVELGHRTRGGTWVPAQPFIRPSIDAAKRGLI